MLLQPALSDVVLPFSVAAMDPKWFPPPDRPVRPGSRDITAANAIGMAALLLPPGQCRNVIAIPPFLAIIYTLRQHTTGRNDEDYLTAVNVCMMLIRFIDFCVVNTPEQSFRRVRSDGRTETPQEIQNMTIWQKLRWNFDLFATLRGIGWNWRVKNVDDVRNDISRRCICLSSLRTDCSDRVSGFVLEQVVRATCAFAYIDVHEWYMRRTPFGDGTSSVPDLFSLSLREQVVLAWCRAFHSGSTMAFGYYLVAVVLVATGISSPQS